MRVKITYSFLQCIVGLGNQYDVIISCHPLTRVFFTMSDDITIESLTFLDCIFGTRGTSNDDCDLVFPDSNNVILHSEC